MHGYYSFFCYFGSGEVDVGYSQRLIPNWALFFLFIASMRDQRLLGLMQTLWGRSVTWLMRNETEFP